MSKSCHSLRPFWQKALQNKYQNMKKDGISIQSKTKEVCLFLLKLAVLTAVFVFVLLNFHTLKNLDVRALVAAAPSFVGAVCIVLGIYALKGLVFVIPASLIYLSVGMAFSPFTAVLVNLGGILVELTVSYLFGLFLGGDKIRQMLANKKGGQKILEMQNSKRYTTVFLMRLIPAFPIDFVSLFLGGTKEAFFPYLLFSFLGIAPRVILFTLLGDKIYDLIPMKLIIGLILLAIPIAGIVFAVQYIKKQKQKGKPSNEAEASHAKDRT